MNREEIGKLADIVIRDMRTSEALAKQKPMKPYNNHVDGKCCPTCFEVATFQTWKHGYPVVIKMNYCQNCGQAIDWSEE